MVIYFMVMFVWVIFIFLLYLEFGGILRAYHIVVLFVFITSLEVLYNVRLLISFPVETGA